MYYFKDKLLLSLLLSSTLLIAHDDQDNKKELNEFIQDTCKSLPGGLLSFVVLKRYEEELPAEKFIGAEFLKRYIVHNTECSEDTAEKIAQCTVSLVRRIKDKKEGDETYRYRFDKPWVSIPKTLVRELLLSELTRICHEEADKLKMEHPPEIKNNKKLYESGEFLIKSVARHAVDYGLSQLLIKLGINP